MDAARFDDLLRRLSSSSRRGLLLGLTGGLLAFLSSSPREDAAARKKRKKKRHRCTPDCAGKSCGKDACGGSCGPCTGGSCQNGTCVCAGTLELCRGACVPGCIGEAVLNPLTCACCQTGPDCTTDDDCCSGICQPNTGGGPDFCVRRDLGAACDFDGQCTNCSPAQCPPQLLPICRNETCACPDGAEACGGECVPTCTGPNAKIPGTCSCCRRNGQSCGGFTPCCSGNCSGNVCFGLPPDADCTFDAQCASGSCTLGFCDN